MGRSILGTKKTVRSFSREKINQFITNNYKTDEIVISSVGNIRFNRLLRLINKHFADIPANTGRKNRKLLSSYSPEQHELKKRTYQTHCVIGNLAYSLKHDNRLGMYLLNNLLGGPGLSSRLNMSLREKNGYSYNTESNYTPYSDTGAFSVYFGTDKHNLDKSMNLVLKEFRKLRDVKLGIAQLTKAKRQLIGQIAISSENYENHMLSMGKGFLVYNRVDSFPEIVKKIENLSSAKLLEIANEVLNERHMSYLIYN